MSALVSVSFLLAGGGGLRPGRWLRFDSQPHNNLLVSILNPLGDPYYCTGPLVGLT